MKFSSTIFTTVFVASVFASPVAEKSNIEVPLDFVPVIPTLEPGKIVVTSGISKRDAALKKRTLVVDIWDLPNKGGRYEGLWTEEQRCCTLVSSLGNFHYLYLPLII